MTLSCGEVPISSSPPPGYSSSSHASWDHAARTGHTGQRRTQRDTETGPVLCWNPAPREDIQRGLSKQPRCGTWTEGLWDTMFRFLFRVSSSLYWSHSLELTAFAPLARAARVSFPSRDWSHNLKAERIPLTTPGRARPALHVRTHRPKVTHIPQNNHECNLICCIFQPLLLGQADWFASHFPFNPSPHLFLLPTMAPPSPRTQTCQKQDIQKKRHTDKCK